MQRTHLAPGWRRLRPPFHGLWKLKAHADIEFPPSVAYGKVYVAQQKGRFFALNARTGKIVWTKHFEHCSAASPTISDGIVYQAYMHELPCRKHETGAAGFVVAWNARNGKEYWRVRAGSVESSPLLDRQDPLLRVLGPPPVRLPDPRQAQAAPQVDVRGRRPDRRRARPGGSNRRDRDEQRERLRRRRQDRASALALDVLLALREAGVLLRDARRSPTGASTSATRTARSTPSAPPAGTCSGRDRSGRTSTRPPRSGGRPCSSGPGTGRSSPSTRARARLAGGSTRRPRSRARRRSSPGSSTSRRAAAAALAACGASKVGPRGTWGLNARNGDPVWRFHDGKYSALVADGFRVYISGRNKVYAMITQAALRDAEEVHRLARSVGS